MINTSFKKRGLRALNLSHPVVNACLPSLEEYKVDETDKLLIIKSSSEKQVKAILDEKEQEINRQAVIDQLSLLEFKYIAKDGEEWKLGRLGLITGSDNPFSTSGKPIPTFNKYVAKKWLETLQRSTDDEELKNEIIDTFRRVKTPLMQRGNDLEPLAIEAFISHMEEQGEFVEIEEVGFHRAESLPFGATPDGKVINLMTGEVANLEIKSPRIDNFVANILDTKEYISRYYAQMQIEMVVQGVEKTYFVLFHPKFNPIVEVVELDYDFLSNMFETVELFEKKIDDLNNRIGENK
jgi:hypothetical protein